MMAKGPSYRVQFRRRREGRTDYKARKALISSRLPRAVTRGSIRHMNVQIVEAYAKGDRVIASASSQELKNYGWKGACGNIPSAYLAGLLCGKRALQRKVTKAVPDIGLHQPTKGARVFASVKGLLDAGLDIPHTGETLPKESSLKGQHIEDYAQLLASSNLEIYERYFSKYLAKKINPQELQKHFEAVKQKISSDSGRKAAKRKATRTKAEKKSAKAPKKKTAKTTRRKLANKET